MEYTIELKLQPKNAGDDELIRRKCAKSLKLDADRIQSIELMRRSIDARKKHPKVILRVKVYVDEAPAELPPVSSVWQHCDSKPEVLIVGAGPAGYFAAMECIELGLKPIVLDRGKDVQTRRRDLRAIQQFSKVHPDSNYCFGEGGAGTYSDGKLYTRATKRGDHLKVLKLLVEHGANPDIMINAHPHIGSNKLPKIITNIRDHILEFGGEVHFNTRLTKFLIEANKIRGLVDQNGKEYLGSHVILATGHSARDIYKLLHDLGIFLERKDFALGIRIEHPQALIDEIQYNQKPRDPYLPAASYRLACQVGKNGVFSFCMCPGGLIVPTATSPGEIVLNGMSLSRRDSPFANAGVVTPVTDKDDITMGGSSIFSGLALQQMVEQELYQHGDGSQKAPAQRLDDFLTGKLSNDLNACSYIPGIYAAPLHKWLPPFIYDRIRMGIFGFERKMRGFITSQANVLAPESRTSSPIRIPRDKHSFMHPELQGLFPCGEGAGYAGGILSAAMDGQNVARAVKRILIQKKS